MIGPDEDASVWQYVETVGKKKNTYTMTVKVNEDGTAVPVRYEMFGYDSLLGSHYDKYYIDYNNFQPEVKDDEFNIPGGLSRFYVLILHTFLFVEMQLLVITGAVYADLVLQ